jgi:hypothetical protein
MPVGKPSLRSFQPQDSLAIKIEIRASAMKAAGRKLGVANTRAGTRRRL